MLVTQENKIINSNERKRFFKWVHGYVNMRMYIYMCVGIFINIKKETLY